MRRQRITSGWPPTQSVSRRPRRRAAGANDDAPPPVAPAASAPTTTAASTTDGGAEAAMAGPMAGTTAPPTTGRRPRPRPPPRRQVTAPVKHVFVIALTTAELPSRLRPRFGRALSERHASQARNAAGRLPHVGWHRTPRLPRDDQRPGSERRHGSDCAIYSEFPSSAKAQGNGQFSGSGCVYPNTALTVADQVTAAGKQWKAYLAGMGSSTCVHRGLERGR